VIIFRHPVEDGRLVKRVIAVAGQTVEIRNKQVFVDGEPVPFPETGQHSDPRVLPAEMSRRDNMGPVTVPEGRLWVMGDNREDSIDSRSWGFLDSDLILGKAMVVLYSFENARHKPFWRRIRWSRFLHTLR
jgi:signal peptidase I